MKHLTDHSKELLVGSEDKWPQRMIPEKFMKKNSIKKLFTFRFQSKGPLSDQLQLLAFMQ